MRGIEKILSTIRQYAHGSNAKSIFAHEGKEQNADRHTEMLSDSGGLPALVPTSSADESR